MVNFRSKSNSPCRSKKTRNESPIRITLNIKTKLRIAEKHKQESKTILHLAEELKIPLSDQDKDLIACCIWTKL